MKEKPMARPQTRDDLLEAAGSNYTQLQDFIKSLTEQELVAPFDFSKDVKRKEVHWKRDKNLRDILIHLYEWHQLLLTWVQSNIGNPEEVKPFLPAPYNWRNYGEMNLAFTQKHQTTSLPRAKELLQDSHKKVMTLIESFTNEELFSKGMYLWVGTTTLGSYCVSATASHYDWALKKLKAHRRNCKTL